MREECAGSVPVTASVTQVPRRREAIDRHNVAAHDRWPAHDDPQHPFTDLRDVAPGGLRPQIGVTPGDDLASPDRGVAEGGGLRVRGVMSAQTRDISLEIRS